ncbi:MAG: anthranilate phosphoribosyltransferase [Alphaproteobacteria bacterium]|jgi:anthranilate phosphoribosyltransferase|nr:anthranilate phosphoribosyltransferase [Alphaproteobacteria bacterium]
MPDTGPGATAGLKPFLGRVAQGERLSEADAAAAFEIIMSGEATAAQIGGFLMALRVRGETVEEITGAARIMRAKALTIDAPDRAMDCCGTGGDASGSYNVSTAVSFVLAAAGIPVAKHGNRALSSRSGAADVLAALGVNIDADMEHVRRALWDANLCFLMAPRHHGAMRHVGPTRVELGTRTIFNLLGPLSNPAGVRRQLLGVFSPDWLEPLARVLGQLGAERAWVVHGADGLDELTTTGPTDVAEWRDGAVRRFAVSPEDAGLPRARPDTLRGGDAETNAAALKALLGGAPGPYRDIVLLNAAAALIIADRVETLADGARLAAQLIDGGHARAALDHFRAITLAPMPAAEAEDG